MALRSSNYHQWRSPGSPEHAHIILSASACGSLQHGGPSPPSRLESKMPQTLPVQVSFSLSKQLLSAVNMSHLGESKNETRAWLQEPGNRRQATRQSCVSHQRSPCVRGRAQRETEGHTRSRGLKASRVKKESSSRSSNSTRGQESQPSRGLSES